MINKKYVFFFLTVIMLATSCSKNRNTWFNRKYQNTVSRFNYYYNGSEKLKEMKASLELNNKDDYTKILNVFPYGGDDAAKQQGPLADEIIKKTSKIILDRPLSKWVDDSYLMLGKAYLFKGDYYAAQDAFTYVMSRYSKNPIAKDAEVWNLYALVRNNKYDDAEATLLSMKNEENKIVLSKETKPFYNSVAAQIMIEQKKYLQATVFLNEAINATKKNKDKARLYFVMAQVQEKLKETDSVKFYLRKVLKSNPNFDMAFEAKLSIAKSYDPENPNSIREARKYLYSMLKEDKNITYFDQIYYQLALIDQQDNNIEDAIKNFKNSAASSTENKNQKGLTFLALAELYYSIPDYKNAQSYFDSTIQFLQKDYPNYDAVYKKQSILSELIKYKVQIQLQDSLLALSTLSPEQLNKIIDKWIDEEERRKEDETDDQNSQLNANFLNQNATPSSGDGGSGATWYFYNKVNMVKGKSEFDKKWNNRKLEDNWRISAILKNQFSTKDNTAADGSTDANNNPEESDIRSAYKADIPDTEGEKKDAHDKIMKALLKVGNIYFEQLKDMKEAIINYELLLKKYPESEYEPEVLYKLYRAHEISGNTTISNTYKQKLSSKYPNSDYAKVANNISLNDGEETGKEFDAKGDFYEKIYNIYSNKNYAEVIRLKDTAIPVFNTTSLSPKYALLYTYSIGKTLGKEAYMKELEKIISQYPGSKEALVATTELDNLKQGQSLINDNPNAKEKLFGYNATAKHWALIAVPNGRVDMNKIKVKLSDFNDVNFKLVKYEVSSQYIDRAYQLVLVKTFDDKKNALDYIDVLKRTQNLFSDFPEKEFKYWTVTEENYLQIMKQKQIEPYEIFYNKYYK